MTVQAHWLAFYADRFVKETAQLNPFEVATYYRLFESYAQTGHLVDDLFILTDIARLNSAIPAFQDLTGTRPDRAVWSDFIDLTINGLLTRFFKLAPDGTYHHPGWDAELAKATSKFEARVKGGRSRWPKTAGGNTENEINSKSETDIESQTEKEQPEPELTARTKSQN